MYLISYLINYIRNIYKKKQIIIDNLLVYSFNDKLYSNQFWEDKLLLNKYDIWKRYESNIQISIKEENINTVKHKKYKENIFDKHNIKLTESVKKDIQDEMNIKIKDILTNYQIRLYEYKVDVNEIIKLTTEDINKIKNNKLKLKSTLRVVCNDEKIKDNLFATVGIIVYINIHCYTESDYINDDLLSYINFISKKLFIFKTC